MRIGGYHILPSLRIPSACADSAEKSYLRRVRWRRTRNKDSENGKSQLGVLHFVQLFHWTPIIQPLRKVPLFLHCEIAITNKKARHSK
jgi:hypothetical protein